MIYRFFGEHLTHIRSSGRIAYHSGAAAEKRDGRMTVLLHPRHSHNRNIMSYMKRVCRRIETYVKFKLLGSESLLKVFVVNGLFYEAPFLKYVVNVLFSVFHCYKNLPLPVKYPDFMPCKTISFYRLLDYFNTYKVDFQVFYDV